MKRNVFQIALAGILLAAIIVSCSGCGDDPVEPVDPPRIAEFTALPIDIMPGDSTLLSYRVTGADSLKLYPDNVRLTPATSGDRYVKPPRPTEYGLVGYNEGGKDSASVTVTMTGAMPSIETFDLTPDTLLIGGSTDLAYAYIRADSITIADDTGVVHRSSTSPGVLVRQPTYTTVYTAIAYNEIGEDTASVTARVEVPFAVNAVYGSHFTGSMGGGIEDPAFRFRILDADDRALRLPWLYFARLEGDGYLTADSAKPDGNGAIWNDYIFSGQLGYGVVRAKVPEVDSIEVKVRASVLRLGPGGQGQYIKFEDTYADVLALNGTPERVDEDLDRWINYAVYENALGVVVPIEDVNHNYDVDANEPVLEVFVNTVFAPTTLDGIGIGTPIADVRAVYGDADFHEYYPPDPPDPASEAFYYNSVGAIFFALALQAEADSPLVEIHLWEPVPPGAPPAELKTGLGRASTSASAYRRFYRR